MSNYLKVMVVVEGQTEKNFIKDVLGPYCSNKSIYMEAAMVTKKGQNGGDVNFTRVERDVSKFLYQKDIDIVTTFVDYYGLNEWPDKDKIKPNDTPFQIADLLNNAAQRIINTKYSDLYPEKRFVSFMAIHEFEALLFSDSAKLAIGLNIQQTLVEEALSKVENPEYINNSPRTAPSKRINDWANGRYRKATTGIAIARSIGIEPMRSKCPLFDAWLKKIENKLED